MDQTERFLSRMLQIDTNRINSRGNIENMNRLEKWREDGVILVEMSEVAQKECLADRDPKRAEKTFGYIFSETLAETTEEQELLTRIERILFPEGAKTQNEKNDVEIVFNAKKYVSILVTADGGSKSQPGGILGHKEELAGLGIQVMNDEEAVQLVRGLIADRDRLAARKHERFGVPLPDWVGRD